MDNKNGNSLHFYIFTELSLLIMSSLKDGTLIIFQASIFDSI